LQHRCIPSLAISIPPLHTPKPQHFQARFTRVCSFIFTSGICAYEELCWNIADVAAGSLKLTTSPSIRYQASPDPSSSSCDRLVKCAKWASSPVTLVCSPLNMRIVNATGCWWCNSVVNLLMNSFPCTSSFLIDCAIPACLVLNI
ncbi:hypothetical protein M758_10G078900, partial [Ceratodon purpureus]